MSDMPTSERARSAPDAVLRLADIARTYNPGTPAEVRVLAGVSLDLHAGEAVGLVAPSGAGKSTLLHIAGLLDTPDAGRVEIEGCDLSQASDRARTLARRDRIGFVYQFHHLLPEFSALENVMLPQLAAGASREAARQRATALLALVEVDHRARHRPAELSGGERQRVAIARALANRPRILLADEPTGNLDPTTAEHVFTMLMTLVHAEGVAALIATHNHALAARMDRRLELRRGRLLPQG